MQVTQLGRSHQPDGLRGHTVLARRASALLTRSLAALALGLAVSACVPDTTSVSISPPKGASLEVALQEYVIASGTAELIDTQCRSYGIRKNYSSYRELTFDYVRKLQAQGYSEADIIRVIDSTAGNVVVEEGIRRLKARGVRQNDDASLCGYAKEEIAMGTTIGKLLRLTK